MNSEVFNVLYLMYCSFLSLFHLFPVQIFLIFKYCILILLFFVMFSFSLQAAPLFTVSSPLWDKNSTIYVANCAKPALETTSSKSSQIHVLKPLGVDKSFKFLDIACTESKYLYAVSSEQEKTLTSLYHIAPHQEKPEAFYKLPIALHNASLLIKEIKIEGKLIKLLLLAGNNPKSSYAALFNDSSSGKDITLIREYEHGMQSISKTCFMRLPKEGWTILLAGQEVKGSGALHFIFLEKTTPPITLRTSNTNPISNILVLDIDQRNAATELLAWDRKGDIWETSLESLSTPKKIAQNVFYDEDLTETQLTSKSSKATVVKNISNPGISIYFLGKEPHTSTTSLFRLDKTEDGKTELIRIDPFNARSSISDAIPSAPITITTVLQPAALYTRFGRIILIPDDSHILPKTLELTRQGEKTIAVSWTNILFAQLLGQEILKTHQVLQTQLLWDPIQEKEVLVSLNQNCELKVVSAPVTQEKYGRIMWRKIN